MSAIRWIWRNAKKPLDRLWKWAKGHPERWRKLAKWAKAKRDQARHDHRIARAKWWMKKRTVYRKKYKQAKRRASETGEVKWEDWMANGYNANVVQGVKDFIARGVVVFGLYTTSLRRDFVPPGGSPTSYHLVGKAGDIAGARMADFQRAERERNLNDSNCLELFGPDNYACLKYGNPISLGEGTALEQLHDTHCHGAFNQ